MCRDLRIRDQCRCRRELLQGCNCAEFLYECVERTVDFDLPFETKFLKNYDNFRRHLEDIVDMPDRLSDLLFRFLHQNQGKLSKRARENEFRQMTQTEIERIEEIYDGALGKE
jgi:hypothetical protein